METVIRVLKPALRETLTLVFVSVVLYPMTRLLGPTSLTFVLSMLLVWKALGFVFVKYEKAAPYLVWPRRLTLLFFSVPFGLCVFVELFIVFFVRQPFITYACFAILTLYFLIMLFRRKLFFSAVPFSLICFLAGISAAWQFLPSPWNYIQLLSKEYIRPLVVFDPSDRGTAATQPFTVEKMQEGMPSILVASGKLNNIRNTAMDEKRGILYVLASSTSSREAAVVRLPLDKSEKASWAKMPGAIYLEFNPTTPHLLFALLDSHKMLILNSETLEPLEIVILGKRNPVRLLSVPGKKALLVLDSDRLIQSLSTTTFKFQKQRDLGFTFISSILVSQKDMFVMVSIGPNKIYRIYLESLRPYSVLKGPAWWFLFKTAYDKEQQTLYATDLLSRKVRIFSTAPFRYMRSIPLPDIGFYITVDSRRDLLYVASPVSDQVMILSPKTSKLLGYVFAGRDIRQIQFLNNGHLLVTNIYGLFEIDVLAVIKRKNSHP